MLIENLDEKARKACELETDHRWTKWAKFVEKVDPKGKDGYAFAGPFIKDGTIEVSEEYLPKLILCCAETGSAKYRNKTYAVAIMHRDGTITPTGLTTNDKTTGWALRLRDNMINRMVALSVSAGDATDDTPPMSEIQIRTETLTTLRNLQQALSEIDLSTLLEVLISSYAQTHKA